MPIPRFPARPSRCRQCRRRPAAFVTAIYCRPCADVLGCAATGFSAQDPGGDDTDDD